MLSFLVRQKPCFLDTHKLLEIFQVLFFSLLEEVTVFLGNKFICIQLSDDIFDWTTVFSEERVTLALSIYVFCRVFSMVIDLFDLGCTKVVMRFHFGVA